MQPKRDYYEVLEVPRDADAKTIKRAFLKKARTLHPDVSDDPDAEEKFKEVNEAYSTLSDEQKRANYDRYGDPSGPAGFGSDYVDMSDIFGGGFGVSDIFDTFFGGGGARAAASQRRTRGRDMGIRLRVTLEEAAAGCTKTISYDRLAPCDDCAGTGVAAGGKVVECPECHGMGYVSQTQRTIFGTMQTQGECPTCHGQGKVVDTPCETCDGQGRTPNHEKVEVKVPVGADTGTTVRIREKGEAGVRGDACGDLVATIEVEPHDRFERHGDDLYCQVDVDALEAIVGTTVTIDGILAGERVEVKVPAGVQYGQQVLVARAGMPRGNTTLRGSLIAVIKVNVPTDLSKSQLKQVAAVVADRAGEGTVDDGAPAEDDREQMGESFGKNAAAEYFAEDAWRAPENPFAQAEPKAKAKPRPRKGRRK